MADSDLTLARASEVLRYDPQTGRLYWRINMGQRGRAGRLAGSLNKVSGYRQVAIDGVLFQQHRIVFLLVTGAWPQYEIDHRDGDKSNNKFDNLRDEPHIVNRHNLRTATRISSSGLLGVCAIRGRWRATIGAFGIRKHLGYFSTKEEAHERYLQEKRLIHPGCTI